MKVVMSLTYSVTVRDYFPPVCRAIHTSTYGWVIINVNVTFKDSLCLVFARTRSLA